MFAFQSRIEIISRVFLTAVMLVNALVPTAALAAPGPVSSPSAGGEVEKNLPRSLPEQKLAFYDPPVITYPQRTSPEPDKVKPPVPSKGQVEFTLTADPAVVPANGLVTFHVRVRNHSKQALTSLVFSDSLESGLEYSATTISPVMFDAKKKEVSLTIKQLGMNEEFNFSYSVTVNSSKRNAVKGRAWLHTVQLNSSQNDLHLKTGAVIAVELANVNAQGELVPLNPEGGWNAMGRVSVHMPKENVGQNALVMSSPAKVKGKGPALQFQLDVYETSSLSVDSQSQLEEQAVSLKKPNKAAFKKPAFLEINLDGYVDLKKIPAGQEPYVATYDEEHKIWVKVPILETDLVDNSVTVEAAHFSTWGAGLGESMPQNGANVLLFDQPYTSLFTGSARYSIPVWMPPGRGGMQPDISLSYSSGTVDGVLGDVQAPWVGVGWNIDDVEIVRKITTDENGYGYRDQYALTLNGSLYDLVQDEFHANRYYTDKAAFLYIERHNDHTETASKENTTGEWWEVVTTDGTRYRLGWNKDSEQLALMYGYSCTTVGSSCWPDGAYASLGYAGKAKDLVALRWRVDRVSDPHGNYMEYKYKETPSDSTIAQFDRESYLESISYTGFDDPNGDNDLSPAYQIYFTTADRASIGDVPTEFNLWDNRDTKYLQEIAICQLENGNRTNTIRRYTFGYSLATVPNANGTLTLTSLKVTGGGYEENGINIPLTEAPTIRFTYQDMDNRLNAAKPFKYPRLVAIDNGAGGVLTFTYGNDGRGSNSWYNYRVRNVSVDSGLAVVKKQAYTYATPLYTGQGTDPALGNLIGYTTVTESLLDFLNNDAPVSKTKHTFGTSGLDTGREMETEWQNGSNTVLRKSTNTYVTDNAGAPKDDEGKPFAGWNYRYLKSTVNYERSGGTLTQTSKTEYYNDPYTGNLLVQSTYLGNSLYRKTYYEYVKNSAPEVYILDKVARIMLVDAANQIYSDTRYHYDGGINQAPTRGDVTLVQKLTGNGNETVDTVTEYDAYGNATYVKVKQDGAYGAVNSLPTTLSTVSSTTYDAQMKTYPITVTNALDQSSSTTYFYTLGVPYQTTDPNVWTTSKTYDGLGRSLSITPPGLSGPGTKFTYPPLDGNGRLSAPYSVKMEIWDALANPQPKYRSVWGLYDGAGRILQTQAQAGNQLLVTSTQFNVQGLTSRQSLPYELTGTGGNYIYDPGSQFTTTQYDALGRAISVTSPGDITSQMSYDGLTTTSLDPNGNKVSRTTDGLGRLISVAEFSDASTVYATTTYFYDSADRLIQVKDAEFNTTTITYDWLGRKTGMDDPDMGIWTYGYDALGNMTSQTDARGEELTFVYDALNRLTTKSDDDPGTLDSTYTYGTQPEVIGMRVRMVDPSGETSWSYSDHGRNVKETRTIGKESQAETHSITTNADWLGRAITTIYDEGKSNQEVITYAYDELGRPKQLNSDQESNTLVDLAYNALGQISEQHLGNGTVVTNTYDASTTRLKNRKALNANSVTLLDLSYLYDLNGNITRLTDKQLDETQFYQYDFLNRLTRAIGANGMPALAPSTPETYGQQFEYDKIGNIDQIDNWGTPPVQQQGQAPAAELVLASNMDPTNAEGFQNVSYLQANKAPLAPVHPPVPAETLTPPPPLAGIDDPYTVALLHMNGEDTSAAFTDESGKTWTAAGNTQIDTAQGKFETASGLFDGAGDFISAPDNPAWRLDDGSNANEWTIDFWVKFNVDPGTGTQGFVQQYSSVDESWVLRLSNNTLSLLVRTAAAYSVNLSSPWDPAANTWYHVAVVKNGTSGYLMFVDGMQIGSAQTDENPIPDFDGALRVGDYIGSSGSHYYLNGWLDELRISKGTARWTTHFTPSDAEYDFDTSQPTATPTPGVDNFYTTSLLHMNGTDGSTLFGDESGKTWIAAGNAQLDTADSKFGGTSALFDGAGDILSTLDSPDWRLDAGSNANEWTMDFWVKFNVDPGTGTLGFVQQYTSVNEFWALRLSNNTLSFLVRTDAAYSAVLSSPWDPAANTWYHVAVVKNGTAGYLMFVDGLQIGHAQVDDDVIPDFSGTLRVGDYINTDGAHYYLNGRLDELRISKGVARWTTHFTPPSAEYLPGVSQPTPVPTPGIDNVDTVSLLHMSGTDGSKVFGDESGKTWIAAGDAQIGTADSKFGGSAGLFDGAGDTLSTLDSPDWQLDAGSNVKQWTIDFWVKFNGDPGTGAQGIAQQRLGANDYWTVVLSNNALHFIVYSGGATIVHASNPWDPAANTWYHVAVVKNGASGYLMFVDGMQIGHAQIDDNVIPDFDGVLRIGDYIDPASAHNYLNGWLDELRISKGVARWTTHFTPPSAEYLPGVSQPTPAPTPGVDNIYTASLLHMNGTDTSRVFGDESGKTWIAAGDAQLNTADPKFGGSSGLFDGAGDTLSTLDSPDWQLDAGSNAKQWTIDFWVKFNGDPGTGTQGFVQQYTSINEFWAVRLSNNTLSFIVRTAAAYSVNLSSPWDPAANTWYHVAVVKNGTLGYLMFVDGTQIGSAQTDVNPIPDFAGALQVGDYITSGGTHCYLNGWLDEFRIIKGIAYWTDSFTRPTAEYLPQQGTQGALLAHWKFESTPTPGTVSDESPVDAIDNAATLQNGATLVSEGANGNAVSFDGTDDFASVANDTEIRRNGSFTLSAWVNPSAGLIDGTQYIVNKGTSETDFDYGFVVTSTFGTPVPTSPANVDPNGKLVFRVGDLTPDKVIGPILPADTWTLVTGVYDKSKGELRLYINGKPAAVEKVTGTVSMSAADLTFSSTTKAYSGKLDEVRLYNRALTNGEVESLFGEFAIPTPPPTPTPTALPPVGVGAYDDAHSAWTYTGAWTASTASSAANGTVHYTSTMGNSAELNFTGVKFTLMFTKASNRGLIDVYVDGAKIDTINSYSATGLYQQTYTSPLLPEGAHTARFVYVSGGTRIDIDQIQIYTPVTPVGPGIYDDSDRIWSRSGNAQIDTAQSVFGGASARFDGTGDYLSTLDSPDFNFGTGDFTIDFQVRFNALPTAGNHSMLFSQVVGNNKQALSLFNSNGTYLWQYAVTEGGTNTVQLSFATPGVTTGTWYHVALVRHGNNWYLFRDGVQQGSTQDDDSPVPDIMASVQIGRDPGNALYDFNGWLDELRISKGIARWTTGFTPPPAEYTDTSDVVALLHMNGPDGTTTFRNEIDTPWRYSGTWTAWTGTGPANGTMHYTSTVGDAVELTFTGVQFTLSFAKSSTRRSIYVYVDGVKVDTINAYSTSTLWQQVWTSTTYPLGTHVVRFVSATTAGTIDIDQIEIFDAPATTVGPGIYDDADRVWSPTGNAQIDTAQSVFGGASALFDGTGDYLSVPDSADFDFGTGDFTIDFRVRFNALPAAGKYSTLFSQVAGDNKQVLSLFNSSGTYIWQYVVTEAGTDNVQLSFADTGLTPGTWYHIALVRSGNDWYLFQDGIQQASLQSDDSAVPDIAGVVYIGHDPGNALYDFNGWLDEVQISKDIARWTANFTPPTAEYADITKVVALLHMNGPDSAVIFKNDLATPWRYSGVWRLSKATGPANGTLHYTNTVGDYAELLFDGVQFTLTFTKISNRGKIDVYVDGTKVDTIDAYSATTLYKQTYLSPIFADGEHTVRFVHAGVREYIDIDSIQIHAVPTTPTTPVDTPVGAGVYDDAHNAWRYSADWTTWTGTGPANGTLHYTDKVGKYAELTFNGTQFTLTFTKSSNRSSVDVYVDSVKVDTIDAHNTTTLWQQTWTSPTYPAGAHVVRFVHAGASGTNIDIDQIQIMDTPVALVGPGTYDDSDRIWSPTGNAQIDTAQSVFGGASALFDGTGDALSVPDSPDFHFGASDFTIDFRVRFNALPAAGNHSMLFSQVADSSNKQAFSLFSTSENAYAWQYIVTEGGSDTVLLSFADSGMTAGVWYHIALVRAGNNWYLFRDGILQGSPQSEDSAVPDITAVAQIGRDPGNSLYDFNGWLDEYRVSKGIARWTANFDLPTTEYTETSNVVTLLHMNGPDSATTFTNHVRTWSYSGAWTTWTGTGPANGTLHTTSLAGSYAELLFNGRQFTLTFTMASNRGVIEIYLDGTRIKTINAYNATALWQQTYISPVYPAGVHTVRIVYRDTRTLIDIDRIQIDGVPAPLGAGTYDDTNSAWFYSGAWIPTSSSGAYNDTFHYTETVGDYAEVQFSGTQFTLTFTTASNRGKIDVYVDGNRVTTINAYSATTLYQQTWTSPVFAAGTHSLRLVHAGSRTYIDVDALQIYAASVATAAAGPYDDTADVWTYTGVWTAPTDSGAYNATLHSTGTVGAAAQVTFRGTQFTLRFTKAINRGSIDVYVDEVKVTTINAYSATTLYQQTYTSPVYLSGTHTVRFVHAGASGKVIDVDAIQVLNTPPPTPAPADWQSSEYTYSLDAPHAVASVNRHTFEDSFTYDKNGNMTCRVENGVTYKQEYNAENRISAIHTMDGDCDTGTAVESWSYTYDGDGVRTTTSHITGSGDPVITRYYFGGAYETTDGAWKKYYSFGGTTLMRDSATNSFKYFLSDHLGSVSVVLDEDGEILEQQRYLPFGAVRTDLSDPPYRISSTDLTYTGQRDLPGTGLMDYKARFYSPTLGRFIQPDTMIPGAANPQSWNRFSYVTDNPIRYNDPSGHMFWEGEGGNITQQEKNENAKKLVILETEQHKRKCKAGNKNYCPEPVHKVLLYSAAMLVGAAVLETFVLGGGLAAAGDAALWQAGKACISSAACRWITGAAGGAGTGRTVLSGHGGYNPANGTTTVPEGTTLHTYADLDKPITDKLGNAIETGAVDKGLHIFKAGSQVPNLTLYPPTGLKIMGNPTTVTAPTLLSDLLEPNMGNVHWAACLVLTKC